MLKDSLFVEVADGWNASECFGNAKNYLFNMGGGEKYLNHNLYINPDTFKIT